MAENRPEWMADNYPEWMAKNYPDLYGKHKNDDEVPQDIMEILEKKFRLS
jgi:beta-galactosidase GanA